MELDSFSLNKRLTHVGNARVAYFEAGTGEPVVLLHGCPFSSFIWRKVIPRLSGAYRCLAPDILGLGDTETLLAAASAVKDMSVLTTELVQGYIRANLSDAHRRAKTRRFLAGQLDLENNRCTLDLLEGLRKVERTTMIVWGQGDPHFGPEWAHKLYEEIPGAARLELLPDTGHLLMEEKPEAFASLLLDFFSQPVYEQKSVAPVD